VLGFDVALQAALLVLTLAGAWGVRALTKPRAEKRRG
jgi:hypothetical protein